MTPTDRPAPPISKHSPLAVAALPAEARPGLLVCSHCSQVHRWIDLPPAGVACCSRCDAVLARGHRLSAEALLALTMAALVVFIIANSAELITIRLRGTEVATTLPMAIGAAWRDGAPMVAALATLTALVAPLVFIVSRLLVLFPLAIGRVPSAMGIHMRILHEGARWNTVSVLGVGALLSLVRIAELAQASAGPGLVAMGVLAVLLAAVESAGLRHLWPVQENAS